MKTERLLGTVMLLLQKKKTSAQELADIFEVSLRTIYRDIQSLSLAGIPIHSTSGVGGGFEIMENYKIDKNYFSKKDIVNILRSLSSFKSLAQDSELCNALAKVRSLIPEDQISDLEEKIRHFEFDVNPWIVTKTLETKKEIIRSALSKSQVLSFQYIAHHGKKSSRNIEPYQLILKKGDWYVSGYCYVRQDYRLFKLNRILDMKILPEAFELRDYPKQLFQHTVSGLITIKIKIHYSLMDRILDYCDFAQFKSHGEEYYIVDFPFVENDFYYDILLGFGEKCECLEPMDIRFKMKQKIETLIKLYND